MGFTHRIAYIVHALLIPVRSGSVQGKRLLVGCGIVDAGVAPSARVATAWLANKAGPPDAPAEILPWLDAEPYAAQIGDWRSY